MLRPCGNFKRTYQGDEAIFKTNFTKLSMLALFIVLVVLPFIVPEYQLHFINIIGIFIIGALGINIIMGYTGLISIGHGVFVGLGAYSTALLMIKFNLHFLLALPLGGLITAFLGLVPGFTCLRLKGIYLLISTLAAHVLFNFVIVEASNLTGGDLGLSVPRIFAASGMNFMRLFYFLTFSIVVAASLFTTNLFRHKVGRNFIAIRDNDLAARVLGIPVGKYKLISFSLGSFYAGIAGGLWAGLAGVISMEQFSISLSITFLAIILIGGMGSILGTVYGTIFILLIPEVLANLATSLRGIFGANVSTTLQIINNGIFGIIIIIFLLYEPLGLARIWWKVKSYWKLWPFSYSS
ncbi:MAG: branched-chain amino acid ABC transporter permease [Deltaproteobacteria bacterium]|nr:branched-chain amino acid ABC transporter permease [Deltaproteobacteria bacterium]